MNEISKLNDTKLVKTLLEILLKVDSKKWSHYTNEYDDQSIQYVLPDYDQQHLMNNNNSAYFVDTTKASNESESNASLLSQLSTPILYVVFMFILYALIIVVVFVSAIYSHRRRNGYTFDDDQTDESDSSNSESSDELTTSSTSIKYSKLSNDNEDDQYKQLKNSQMKSETLNETKQIKLDRKLKKFHMKRIKDHFRLRFAKSDRKRLAKYLSMRHSLKPINYLKSIINKHSNFSNASFNDKTNNEYVYIEHMLETRNQNEFNNTNDSHKKSIDQIDQLNENLLSEYKL